MLQYNKAFSKSVNQISVFWETPLNTYLPIGMFSWLKSSKWPIFGKK